MKNGPRFTRKLALTGPALVNISGRQLPRLILPATITDDTVWPSHGRQPCETGSLIGKYACNPFVWQLQTEPCPVGVFSVGIVSMRHPVSPFFYVKMLGRFHANLTRPRRSFLSAPVRSLYKLPDQFRRHFAIPFAWDRPQNAEISYRRLGHLGENWALCRREVNAGFTA